MDRENIKQSNLFLEAVKHGATYVISQGILSLLALFSEYTSNDSQNAKNNDRANLRKLDSLLGEIESFTVHSNAIIETKATVSKTLSLCFGGDKKAAVIQKLSLHAASLSNLADQPREPTFIEKEKETWRNFLSALRSLSNETQSNIRMKFTVISIICNAYKKEFKKFNEDALNKKTRNLNKVKENLIRMGQKGMLNLPFRELLSRDLGSFLKNLNLLLKSIYHIPSLGDKKISNQFGAVERFIQSLNIRDRKVDDTPQASRQGAVAHFISNEASKNRMLLSEISQEDREYAIKAQLITQLCTYFLPYRPAHAIEEELTQHEKESISRFIQHHVSIPFIIPFEEKQNTVHQAVKEKLTKIRDKLIERQSKQFFSFFVLSNDRSNTLSLLWRSFSNYFSKPLHEKIRGLNTLISEISDRTDSMTPTVLFEKLDRLSNREANRHCSLWSRFFNTGEKTNTHKQLKIMKNNFAIRSQQETEAMFGIV